MELGNSRGDNAVGPTGQGDMLPLGSQVMDNASSLGLPPDHAECSLSLLLPGHAGLAPLEEKPEWGCGK